MIQQLRRKFTILVLVGLFFIVLLIVVSINGFHWYHITQQAQRSLQVLVENDGHRPEPKPILNGSGSSFRLPPPLYYNQATNPTPFDQPEESAVDLFNFYTIRLDAAGNILSWFSDRSNLYHEEQIQALVSLIQTSGADFGRVETQFYHRVPKEPGTLLVVLDARMELERTYQLLYITLIVGLLAYLFMGIGASLLIHRMTLPVQDAFERQRQFIWDASHELKTPLAVISANVEVLADEMGENEWLGYIQSEVHRTNQLVQNLLILARMEQNTTHIPNQLFPLSQTILQVALPFESTVFEAGKSLTLAVTEGLTYTGNSDMIQQLVLILLSNAVKYSDPGSTITLTLVPKGTSQILSVHNTGRPISPDALPHIFDRFYREDASHSRDIPGHGLGLAIAKVITDHHGGSISVESNSEQGTCFTVILP